MAFQSGDIQDLLARGRNQNWDPRPDAVSSGPMPDSRLENTKNARLPLDRRPCSTYWLLVGRARGDNVQDEFPHNRNKTFMTLQPRKKVKGSRPPTGSPGEVLLGADAAHIFGSCLNDRRKGLLQTSQAVPFWVI